MDARTNIEKLLWDRVGPPLYYCADCLKAVEVKSVDGLVTVTRSCECAGQIIAPRKSILAGKGGLSLPNKARMGVAKIAAALTGRCV